MKYGIVANPASGFRRLDKKRRMLEAACEVLGGDCGVFGLDTTSAEEFCQCVTDVSQRVSTLVIAGGDGTVSDAINCIDADVTVGYLPLGSACALGQVLGLPSDISQAAVRIRDGAVKPIDLILCNDEKKAIMSSIGINAYTLRTRERILKAGIKGGAAYTVGTINSYFRYKRTDVTIDADGERFTLPKTISTIIGKTPSFGYKMMLMPQAKVDDGNIHLLAVNSGPVAVAYNILKSLVRPISMGEYRKAKHVQITLKDQRYLQVDGNIYQKGRQFDFKILPGAMKLIY